MAIGFAFIAKKSEIFSDIILSYNRRRVNKPRVEKGKPVFQSVFFLLAKRTVVAQKYALVSFVRKRNVFALFVKAPHISFGKETSPAYKNGTEKAVPKKQISFSF